MYIGNLSLLPELPGRWAKKKPRSFSPTYARPEEGIPLGSTPWILTRSDVSYKGSLQFTLLGRIVNEMLYLSPPRGPGFYSPTLLGQLFFFKSIIGLIQIFGGANSYFCRLNFENIKIITMASHPYT